MSVTTSPWTAGWLPRATSAASLAGALAAGAQLGPAPLLAVVMAMQALAVVGLVSTRPPGARGVAAVAVLTSAAADVVVVRGASSLSDLSGVVGLSVLATVVVQLARGVARARVTEAMGSTLGLGLATAALASLVVLRRQPSGASLVTVYALAAGAALLVAASLGAALDRQVPARAVSAGVRSGLALVLGVAAGLGAGAVVGPLLHAPLTRPQGALLGGCVAAVAVLVDLAVALAGAPADPAPPGYLFAGALVALVAAAPVGYLLGQLVGI